MAWARHVGATLAANVTNPGASWNAGNLGATPAVNDRIIAAFDASLVASQPFVVSVADSGGLKWARDFSLKATHNGYSEELSVWSAVSLAGAACNAITATFSTALSASSGCSCAIGAYSGLATGFGLAVDQNGVQDLVFGGAASSTPSTNYDSGATLVGTNKPSELLIGVGADAGNNTTLSAGSGYSIFVKTDANANGQCALQDQDSGAIGSPQESIVTASVAGFYMAVVLVYRLFAGNTQYRSMRPGPFRPGLAR